MLIFASIVVGILVIFSPLYAKRMTTTKFIFLLMLWLVLMGIAYYAGGK
ncbi:MAG TPA: hypothetical protein VEL69_03585 [Ktedonobacteraceae bacterium]|nr:hypothetical protein [Ktedonobacteraceae bacterium]